MHSRRLTGLPVFGILVFRWAFILELLIGQEEELGPPPVSLLEPPSRCVSEAGPASAVDPFSRASVVLFYYDEYTASEGISSGWDGDINSCVAGTTRDEFRGAILRRINFFRSMCRLPAVSTFSADWNPKCQEAALMMRAEMALSHSPGPDWACYTAEGAEAAGRSNLYLGRWGPDCIDGYIADSGTNNTAVGHRRWILYPPQKTMGTGDVTPGYGANALWVIGGTVVRPATPECVAWPSEGFVPYPFVFARWSFSVNRSRSLVDFDTATVTMRQGDSPVQLSIVSKDATGYGDDTIVWEPEGLPSGAPETDIEYHITVENVLVDGESREYTYSVTVIDPARVVTNPNFLLY